VVNAMNHWAEKLGWYANSPLTIKKVLENLPVDPPSLPQFVELMRHAYVPPQTYVIEHTYTEEELARNKKKAAEAIQKLRQMIGTKT
jgi:hypothetical protein